MTETQDIPAWIDTLFYTEDGDISYWGPFAVVIAMQTICFLFCQIVKDNSHIDAVWSWSFMIPNLATVLVLM